LLSAVLIQIFSGLSLFKSSRKSASTPWDKLHLWTGLYLAFFLVIHVGAVLAGRWILHLDTNFYFGVAGLNAFPFNLFFIPYYALAILAFGGHLSAIHSKKRKKAILGLEPNNQSKVIFLGGVVLTGIIFYGLTNHFKGVEIPANYFILIGK
jgi:hypothetical protein